MKKYICATACYWRKRLWDVDEVMECDDKPPAHFIPFTGEVTAEPEQLKPQTLAQAQKELNGEVYTGDNPVSLKQAHDVLFT